jgi:hypothetical protein
MNGKTLPKRTEWGILLFEKEDVRKENIEPDAESKNSGRDCPDRSVLKPYLIC